MHLRAKVLLLLIAAPTQGMLDCAAADPHATKANPAFARLDANRDGYLSYAEARASVGRDRIVGRRYVTIWSHRNLSLAPLRFNLSVMQMPSRPTGGQAVMSENYQGVAIK